MAGDYLTSAGEEDSASTLDVLKILAGSGKDMPGDLTSTEKEDRASTLDALMISAVVEK